MVDLVLNKEKRAPKGVRKRVYLFVVDEVRHNSKVVLTDREQRLMGLRPDFVTNGRLYRCAMDNVLFWIKNPETENLLWHLPVKYYFGNPRALDEAKASVCKDGVMPKIVAEPT